MKSEPRYWIARVQDKRKRKLRLLQEKLINIDLEEERGAHTFLGIARRWLSTESNGYIVDGLDIICGVESDGEILAGGNGGGSGETGDDGFHREEEESDGENIRNDCTTHFDVAKSLVRGL